MRRSAQHGVQQPGEECVEVVAAQRQHPSATVGLEAVCVGYGVVVIALAGVAFGVRAGR